MPRIETIKASQAPPAPKKMSKSSQEIFNANNRLKNDEILRLQPDPDKLMRGLKTSVGWVASSNRIKIESRTNEAEQYLYVRKPS